MEKAEIVSSLPKRLNKFINNKNTTVISWIYLIWTDSAKQHPFSANFEYIDMFFWLNLYFLNACLVLVVQDMNIFNFS